MTQYSKSQDYMTRVMNQHEIEMAIRHATGPRNFDPAIKTIWDRLIDRPPKRRVAKDIAASPTSSTRRHPTSFYDGYNKGFRAGMEAVLRAVELVEAKGGDEG